MMTWVGLLTCSVLEFEIRSRSRLSEYLEI